VGAADLYNSIPEKFAFVLAMIDYTKVSVVLVHCARSQFL